jgi:hypothetical protein
VTVIGVSQLRQEMSAVQRDPLRGRRSVLVALSLQPADRRLQHRGGRVARPVAVPVMHAAVVEHGRRRLVEVDRHTETLTGVPGHRRQTVREVHARRTVEVGQILVERAGPLGGLAQAADVAD